MGIEAAPAAPDFSALRVADRAAIDVLAQAFFAAFCNADGRRADLSCLAALCVPQARLVKAVGAWPEYQDIDGFIAPRKAIFDGGRLTGFSEWEVDARTEVFGNIAQRWSHYRKRGVLDGIPFQGEGWKSLQCVRTPEGWRIAAVAWDDLPSA